MKSLAKFLGYLLVVLLLVSIDQRLAAIASYLKIQTLIMLGATAPASQEEPAPLPPDTNREARGDETRRG